MQQTRVPRSSVLSRRLSAALSILAINHGRLQRSHRGVIVIVSCTHRKQAIDETMEQSAETGGTPAPTKTGGGTTRQPEVIKLALKGDAVLTNPRWNKVRPIVPLSLL
jgi:hypothetical protein